MDRRSPRRCHPDFRDRDRRDARGVGQRERPDAADAAQLAQAGLVHVAALGICTRCHPADLWSYRRDGAGAGRNLSFIWRRSEGQTTDADEPEHS